VKAKSVVAPSVQTRSRPASAQCDVAAIGAGPYGLSAGVHLKAKGMAKRITACAFGEPMEFWAHKMPEGMHALWFVSNSQSLSD